MLTMKKFAGLERSAVGNLIPPQNEGLMNQQIELTCEEFLPTFDRTSLTVSGTAAPACELMFFCGAPFAHVVQYEDYMRAGRKDHESRTLLRSQPPRRWRGFKDSSYRPLLDAYVR